jgi:hypothetical protein
MNIHSAKFVTIKKFWSTFHIVLKEGGLYLMGGSYILFLISEPNLAQTLIYVDPVT